MPCWIRDILVLLSDNVPNCLHGLVKEIFHVLAVRISGDQVGKMMVCFTMKPRMRRVVVALSLRLGQVVAWEIRMLAIVVDL